MSLTLPSIDLAGVEIEGSQHPAVSAAAEATSVSISTVAGARANPQPQRIDVYLPVTSADCASVAALKVLLCSSADRDPGRRLRDVPIELTSSSPLKVSLDLSSRPRASITGGPDAPSFLPGEGTTTIRVACSHPDQHIDIAALGRRARIRDACGSEAIPSLQHTTLLYAAASDVRLIDASMLEFEGRGDVVVRARSGELRVAGKAYDMFASAFGAAATVSLKDASITAGSGEGTRSRDSLRMSADDVSSAQLNGRELVPRALEQYNGMVLGFAFLAFSTALTLAVSMSTASRI
ncbi:MAG: hypothetical protein ITG02_06610 [Patulibacter sp.]|nr:hypothetical protein [Patulibacter sp.]